MACRPGPQRSATSQTKTCLWGPRYGRSLRDAHLPFGWSSRWSLAKMFTPNRREAHGEAGTRHEVTAPRVVGPRGSACLYPQRICRYALDSSLHNLSFQLLHREGSIAAPAFVLVRILVSPAYDPSSLGIAAVLSQAQRDHVSFSLNSCVRPWTESSITDRNHSGGSTVTHCKSAPVRPLLLESHVHLS